MNNKSTKNQPRTQALDVLMIGVPSPQSDALLRELRRAKYDPTPRYVDSLEMVGQSLVEERFDVVIFDETQSQLAADEALRTLRASGIDIPCIVVAEEVDVEMAVGLMRQGAGDCIARHDLHRLAPAIDRELKEADARRQIAQERAAEALVREEQSIVQSSVDKVPPPAHENSNGQSSVGTASTARATNADAPAATSTSNNGRAPSATNPSNGVAPSVDAETSTAAPAINAVQPLSLRTSATQEDVSTSTREVAALTGASGTSGSHDAPAVLAALVHALAAQSDPAAIVHELSVHLKPLLPFDSVGVSLSGPGSQRNQRPATDVNGPPERELSTRAPQRNGAGKPGANGHGGDGNGVTGGASRNGFSPYGDENNAASVTVWASGAAPASIRSGVARWSLEVPLQGQDQLFGTLHFSASREAAFSPQQEQLAHAVAAHVAMALQQSQRLSQAHQSEEKYRLLFSNLDVIVWEVDPVTLRFTL
jgi:DNA-binding NarL/FixJ family response regulator